MLLISSKLELHPLIQQPLGCLTLKTSLSYLPSLIYNLWLVLVIYQIQTSPDTQINNTFTRYHVTYSHSTHTHTLAHRHKLSCCPSSWFSCPQTKQNRRATVTSSACCQVSGVRVGWSAVGRWRRLRGARDGNSDKKEEKEEEAVSQTCRQEVRRRVDVFTLSGDERAS